MASPWLTTEELADRLHLTPKTLANWKLEGRGPTPVKVGRRLLYRLETVERWEKQQERLSRAG
jgi:DNA-binding transcriptional regulator YiaG